MEIKREIAIRQQIMKKATFTRSAQWDTSEMNGCGDRKEE